MRGAVPARAVLLLERHEVAGVVDAPGAAGVVQEHEREQAERLGLVGHELDERAGEADGFGAQPAGARGRRRASPRSPR